MLNRKRRLLLLLVVIIGVMGLYTGCNLNENNSVQEMQRKTDEKPKGNNEEVKSLKKAPQEITVGTKVDDQAPNFTLKGLQGEEVSLEDYRGKIVFINFWASWCPPCKAEMPDINKLYLENKDEDLVVLAVDVNETKTTVEKFIKDGDYEFPVLLDETGKTAAKYSVIGIPKTIVVDPNGIITHKKMGMMTYEEMNEMLKDARIKQ